LLPAIVGLLYAVLAGSLYIISFLRARHSQHDFADGWQQDSSSNGGAVSTVGQDNGRVFGRPFKTAGNFVIAVGVAVAAIEIGLLVLVMRV
jgi:hypothetical protein